MLVTSELLLRNLDMLTIDFPFLQCQALSAAIFHGNASYEVVFEEPNVVNTMLANHTLDVVLSRQYVNMVADVYEVSHP
jgi:hypothetical protein